MDIIGLFCRSKAFRQQLESSRDRLYRMAYSWCHDPYIADDLVQECLSKAITRSSQLRDIKALNGWLFRILNNCWHDYLRSQKNNVEFNEDEHPVSSTSTEKLHSRHEEIHEIRTAIAALSIGQRQVITLVDLEGFSYTEVAEIVNIPIGTVMSRLSRARQALKTELLANRKAHVKPTISLVRSK